QHPVRTQRVNRGAVGWAGHDDVPWRLMARKRPDMAAPGRLWRRLAAGRAPGDIAPGRPGAFQVAHRLRRRYRPLYEQSDRYPAPRPVAVPAGAETQRESFRSGQRPWRQSISGPLLNEGIASGLDFAIS